MVTDQRLRMHSCIRRVKLLMVAAGVVFSTFMLVSCAGSGGETKAIATQTVPGEDSGNGKVIGFARTISDTLYTLYIENLNAGSGLTKLLKGTNKQKATLQFYRDTAGFLSLIAFPSQTKNAHLLAKDTVYLFRSTEVGDVLKQGRAVFLGDLQLVGGVRDSLKRHLFKPNPKDNDTTFRYIWFVPEIREDTITHNQYIFYNVKKSNGAPKTAFVLTSLGYVNPSPPATLE